MRGAASASADAAVLSGFEHLRDKLAHHGMVLPGPAGRYVSANEAVLLGHLAALQQGRYAHAPPIGSFLTPEVQSALEQCATLLEGSGCVLDSGTFALASAHGEALREEAAPRSDTGAEDSWKARRARILRFVEARRLVRACELVALGASRENISSLCRTGSIRRVRHGWYAARSCGRPQFASAFAREPRLVATASGVTANDNDPAAPHQSG